MLTLFTYISIQWRWDGHPFSLGFKLFPFGYFSKHFCHKVRFFQGAHSNRNMNVPHGMMWHRTVAAGPLWGNRIGPREGRGLPSERRKPELKFYSLICLPISKPVQFQVHYNVKVTITARQLGWGASVMTVPWHVSSFYKVLQKISRYLPSHMLFATTGRIKLEQQLKSQQHFHYTCLVFQKAFSKLKQCNERCAVVIFLKGE